MAKKSEKDRVGEWDKNVTRAGKEVTEPWEEKFRCKDTENYYYGKQYGDLDDDDRRRYVINLFYPDINISMPSMLYDLPKYKVEPRPSKINDPLSDAEARAKLQEEALNTKVQSPDIGYSLQASLAILDAQFRIGIVQVGYSADFTDNPTAGKPILKDNSDDPLVDAEGKTVGEPSVRIDHEDLYLKWIDSKTFRVSVRNNNRVGACDWVGYYEWHYIEDLKANKRYKNQSKLQSKGSLRGDRAERIENANEEDSTRVGMVKVWFVWDLRANLKRVWAQGHENFLLEESFSFLPLAFLKFNEVLGSFLPYPPTFNWIHPQDQLNEIREMRRIHRARAKRRYLRSSRVTAEEWAKLIEGDDMVCIEANGEPTNAIVPIADAPLDTAIFRDIADSLDDFRRESGVSGEQQQVAESETATQANLIALAGRVRESSKRMAVGKFLGEIGRLMLMTMRDKFALPIWIQIAVDPASPLAMQEAQEVALLWQQIKAEQLGDMDNEITVDLTSMSPIAQAEERENWMQFLMLAKDPVLAGMLFASPTLLRKTAGYFNIHSERDLQEVSKAFQMVMLQFAAAQAQAAAPKGGGGIGPGPTPSNRDIASKQLTQQLPVEAVQ